MKNSKMEKLVEEAAQELLEEMLLERVVENSTDDIVDDVISKFNNAIEVIINYDNPLEARVKTVISEAMDKISNESLESIIKEMFDEKVDEYISNTF